ncbi:MAG: hypothetical protein CTY15_04505 [Methylocystis sp.]|nr:MAG: hypothetical protein CTY15_04505 [Methylocystis sp.]
MLDAKHIAIGAAFFLAPGLAQAGPAKAAVPPKPGFDGEWVIDARTSSFFCPVKSRRMVATVRGGQVARLTGLPGTATGHVEEDGSVSITLKVYTVTATVRGRLTGGAGAGDWSSNSMLCARGDWRAAQSGN